MTEENNIENLNDIPTFTEEDYKNLIKEMNEIYAELDKEQQKIDEKNKEELEKLKDLISYDIDLIESILDELEYWEYLETVEVEETENPRNGYPSYKFYIQKGEKPQYKYMRQDDEDFHNLVWQTDGGYGAEDSYSGFLLFPLKNGKYWKIKYTC